MAIDSGASGSLTTLHSGQMEKPFIPRAENLLPKVKRKSVAQRKGMDDKYQESRQSSSRGARSQQRKETPLVCLYPNCVAGLFGTHVKLVQHYRRVHLGLPDRRDGTFLCDYERCKRSSVPFRRLDALREHLRKTHKEAIQKNHRAHSGSSIAVQVEHMDWWRCTKCLQKIERNQEKGYCPNHKPLKQGLCKRCALASAPTKATNITKS